MSNIDIYMLIKAVVILGFATYMYWKSSKPKK